MSYIRPQPPRWFWVLATAILLWSLIGLLGWVAQFHMPPEQIQDLPAYDRSLYLELPDWYYVLYAVAFASALGGGAAMLLRSAAGATLFQLSLLALLISFGWLYATTDIVAVKGIASLLFPIFAAGVAGAEIWFARFSRRRGWIH